jgi:hypothetical protein
MTVILTTQEHGSCEQDVAAAIAARLGLDLVPESQLEKLIVDRMDIEQRRLRRRDTGNKSLFARWMVRRGHCFAKYTREELARLAARDNVVIQAWESVGAQRPVQHMICVRVCATAPIFARAVKQFISQKSSWLRPPVDAQVNRASPDLVLNPALMSVAECVEEVHRLVLSPQPPRSAASEVSSTNDLQEARGCRDFISDLPRPTATRVMDVEVGRERVRIAGVTSSEQIIARIEEHLHGKRDYTLGWAPTLPPGVI